MQRGKWSLTEDYKMAGSNKLAAYLLSLQIWFKQQCFKRCLCVLFLTEWK